MTSEKRVQKFHTDDASLPRSPNIGCFLRLVSGKQVNYLRKARKWQSWILDSRYWIADSLSVELGFWITVESWIADFKAQHFRVPQTKASRIADWASKNFPDFGIRITLHVATGGTRHRNAGFALATKSLRTVISSPRLRNKVRHSTAKIRQSMGIDQIKLSYI